MRQIGKYDNFLLISDLDGTLINSKQEISKENLEAVKYFIENGGIFSVATGRTTQNIRLHIKELPIN
uniref:HAD family hydrolase n=1 Tax=Klebsiella pneumoniae TaxID=573 RepID=UPI001C556D97